MIRYAVYNIADGRILRVCGTNRRQDLEDDKTSQESTLEIPEGVHVTDATHRVQAGEFVAMRTELLLTG